ncbi:atp-dependent nucleolar rna, partial [Cystoisospora suis]
MTGACVSEDPSDPPEGRRQASGEEEEEERKKKKMKMKVKQEPMPCEGEEEGDRKEKKKNAKKRKVKREKCEEEEGEEEDKQAKDRDQVSLAGVSSTSGEVSLKTTSREEAKQKKNNVGGSSDGFTIRIKKEKEEDDEGPEGSRSRRRRKEVHHVPTGEREEEEKEEKENLGSEEEEHDEEEEVAKKKKMKKKRQVADAETSSSSSSSPTESVSPSSLSSSSSSSSSFSSVEKVIRKKGSKGGGGILDTSVTFEEFSSLHFDRRLTRLLVHELQLKHPTYIQVEVIPLALQGRDILAQGRTGCGKTLAYVLPMLQRLLLMSENEVNPLAEIPFQALILVPSKELCFQVYSVCLSLMKYLPASITLNHTAILSSSSPSSLPFLPPSILIATPAGAESYFSYLQHLQSTPVNALLAKHLQMLIVDEADLLLSFGYEKEIKKIMSRLPSTTDRHVQTLLLSATLNEEVSELQELLLHRSILIQVDASSSSSGTPGAGYEGETSSLLAEYYLSLPKPTDKWLVLYALLKLDLLPRKCLIFASGISSAYGVRIFLERFGLGCAVLSPTLSIESRQNLIHGYNRGLFEILVTTDGAWEEEEEKEEEEDGETEEEEEEDNLMDEDEEEEEDDSEEENSIDEEEEEGDVKAAVEAVKREASPTSKDEEEEGKGRGKEGGSGKKKKKKLLEKPDGEFGSHRGLDLQGVACVLNFDMPSNVRSYIHRNGRTARGGSSGVCVCLVNMSSPREALLLRKLLAIRQPSQAGREGGKGDDGLQGAGGGGGLRSLALRLTDVECFRYRVEDVCRGITRKLIASVVAKELQQEVLRSRKMQEFFKRNPRDEELLRAAAKQLRERNQAGRSHLHVLPSYLLAQVPQSQ